MTVKLLGRNHFVAKAAKSVPLVGLGSGKRDHWERSRRPARGLGFIEGIEDLLSIQAEVAARLTDRDLPSQGVSEDWVRQRMKAQRNQRLQPFRVAVENVADEVPGP